MVGLTGIKFHSDLTAFLALRGHCGRENKVCVFDAQLCNLQWKIEEDGQPGDVARHLKTWNLLPP